MAARVSPTPDGVSKTVQDPPLAPSFIATNVADAEYLPRAVLTVAPRAIGPVVIEYPYFDGEGTSYIGEFELFIDDSGGVVRVQGAGAQLPKILEDAVRDAFLAARFDPGEVDGQPVRSKIRIEVTFETQRELP